MSDTDPIEPEPEPEVPDPPVELPGPPVDDTDPDPLAPAYFAPSGGQPT